MYVIEITNHLVCRSKKKRTCARYACHGGQFEKGENRIGDSRRIGKSCRSRKADPGQYRNNKEQE